MKKLFFLLAALALAGCNSNGPVPGSDRDGAPAGAIDVSSIPDAVPRVEPITRAGNKSPYTVLGQTYRVMASSSGYKERGIGSWYGTKFHGRTTSNGEPYSLYKMTAAHKTLPIPSYVKVTNLENGKSVIVRINDRGPFHGGRIIDLSYVAAKKLGYADKGTAPVEVEAINPIEYQKNSVEQPVIAATIPASGADDYHLPSNTYLQAGAFRNRQSALQLADQLQTVTSHPIVVRDSNEASGFYKVLLGPLQTNVDLLNLRALLAKAANIQAHVVYQ